MQSPTGAGCRPALALHLVLVSLRTRHPPAAARAPSLSQCRSKELKVRWKEETDQYGASAYQKRPFSWKRPECGVFFKGAYSSVWEAARFSRKQNIPSFPLLQLGDQLQQSLPLPMAFQYIDQTAWSLSLCSAKLPTLSRHDRFNAVKQRIEECHEGETMRNAFEPLELSENPCQKVKPQVPEHQCQAPQNAPRESRTYRKE